MEKRLKWKPLDSTDAGFSDSKIPDILAGYEKAANILQVAFAGENCIRHSAGMLENTMTVTYGFRLLSVKHLWTSDDLLDLLRGRDRS